MAELRQLRRRKKSVESTRQMTAAMQLVASAKVARSQDRLKKIGPILKNMKRWIGAVFSEEGVMEALHTSASLLSLYQNVQQGPHLLVLVSTDQGMCGGFLCQLERALRGFFQKEPRENFRILALGAKGERLIKRVFPDLAIELDVSFAAFPKDYTDCQILLEALLRAFRQGTFSRCTLVYNEYHTILSQKVTWKLFLPLQLEPFFQENIEPSRTSNFLMEPDAVTLVSALMPRYLSLDFYQTLTLSQTSEYAMRMLTMENATKSADRIIRELTISCNRKRQAQITKELIEIISGAGSL